MSKAYVKNQEPVFVHGTMNWEDKWGGIWIGLKKSPNEVWGVKLAAFLFEWDGNR